MKSQSKYVCQDCGYVSARWVGRCPSCGGWNTFVEEIAAPRQSKSRHSRLSEEAAPVPITEVSSISERRITTGLEEFDRVLGGGIVPGSVVFVGGDPGIGKSTLMLQVAAQVSSQRQQRVLYVTGEESVQQIKLRADRLTARPTENVLIFGETSLDLVSDAIERTEPDILIIDSIQTMYRPELESAPGSVSQVRESTALIMKAAKRGELAAFIIGHVTKEGILAGPKVVEHMVDTVLQLEGERHYAYRILRALKNRFGSTNEIGIFEMRSDGLCEVTNPSEIFLSERSLGASGSTVVATLEGTRPILVEVQALVAPTSYGVPQRTSTGIDGRRLAILLAVLERRVGLRLGSYDVFVNVAGGVRIDEPAADLGIAASIASSLKDIPVEAQSVAVGEVGLAGEVRTISHIEKRIQEAKKLGFRRIVVPRQNLKSAYGVQNRNGIEVVGVDSVERAMEILLTR